MRIFHAPNRPELYRLPDIRHLRDPGSSAGLWYCRGGTPGLDFLDDDHRLGSDDRRGDVPGDVIGRNEGGDAALGLLRSDAPDARGIDEEPAVLLLYDGASGLFGGTSLLLEWGRMGSSGWLVIEHHRDEGHAVSALADLLAAKRRHGYW